VTDLRKAFDDLVRFETMLWTAIDSKLQVNCGLTLSNFNVMLIIEATPECRVFDIAEALAITVGGTSQAVDRLEAAGRCVRRPHPTDRRSSIVELTPDAVEVLRHAKPAFDGELSRLIREPLSIADLTRFTNSLDKLRRSAAH
jgi:DNA-binding MarR family transcriptional regulator